MCRSTTTVIQTGLGERLIPQTEATSEPHVALIIPAELKSKLAEIRTHIFSYENLIPETTNVSVVVLGHIFSKLNTIRAANKMSEKELAAHERYKLCLMKAFAEHLKMHEFSHPPANVIDVEDKSTFTRVFEWLKEHCPPVPKIIFGMLFFFGFCFEALFYYVGFAEMLAGLASIFPVFTVFTLLLNPITIVVCGVLMLGALVLYLAFDAAFLAEMFDIRLAPNEKDKLDAYNEQTEVATEINRLLNDVSIVRNVSIDQYICYASFGIKCNELIADRQLDFTDCQESTRKTILRWVVTIGGALLTLGSAYFSGMAILPALALTLSNPLGMVFIAALMGVMFISYFAMQGQGIANLLSPNLDKKREVRDHLNKFSPKDADDFRSLINDKRQGLVASTSSVSGFVPKPVQLLKNTHEGVDEILQTSLRK